MSTFNISEISALVLKNKKTDYFLSLFELPVMDEINDYDSIFKYNFSSLLNNQNAEEYTVVNSEQNVIELEKYTQGEDLPYGNIFVYTLNGNKFERVIKENEYMQQLTDIQTFSQGFNFLTYIKNLKIYNPVLYEKLTIAFSVINKDINNDITELELTLLLSSLLN